MFLAYVRPGFKFVPWLARVTPISEDLLYSLHAGFCRMVGRGHRRSHKKNHSIRNPNPFRQVGIFAVPRSRLGTEWHRHSLKVLEWGATL